MRRRAFSPLGSLVVLLSVVTWTIVDTLHVEAADSGIAALATASRYVAAEPLPTYTIVPPAGPTTQTR